MKVLIPTDFSQQADFAFLMTQKMGQYMPLEQHFLHVLHLAGDLPLQADGTPVEECLGSSHDALRLRAMALDKLELLQQQADNTQIHLAYGPLTDTIANFAADNQFDLVVMGTKGASGLQEMLSGSETQHVVRKCKVPILSMMCDRSDLTFDNILFLHDFASDSHVQLPLLSQMAKQLHSNVHLLYIATDSKLNKAEKAKENMHLFAEKHGLEKVHFHVHISNNLALGVNNFTQIHQMDLLFVGTHQHKGLSKLFHKSVSEKLINHLFKPIITFALNN